MTTDAEVRAAYIHVPFCRHRCGYCDFTLVARRDDLITDYLAALEIELSGLGTPRSVDTLYFGGGTPTHLPADQLARLMRLVRHWLPPADGAEVTVEANPSGLDDERIDVLTAAGVNRVSLGVQSFNPQQLATLERDHTPDDIADVVSRLRPHIPNFSLDLIFAVPGQSLADWHATLEAAIGLQPLHVSTYGLTWERGTTFWSRKQRGVLQPLDDELELAMYSSAIDRLNAVGFDHYELSNFGRPGFYSRHNQVYWRGESYYGFGPGAASYLDGVRRTHHRSVTTWIRRRLAGEDAVQAVETMTPEERAREAILLGLRQRAGIDLAEFRTRYGASPAELEPRAWEGHLSEGLLEVVDGRWRLTRQGCYLADHVISEYL